MSYLPLTIDSWIAALTSPTALTVIVGAAGVAVSVITYIFQKKQLKLSALVEMFKILNLPDHREARRVSYGTISDASYDLLKVTRPVEDESILGEIERVSDTIVRGDLNNAATHQPWSYG